MKRERVEKIYQLLNEYYECEDSFAQTDLAIDLIQNHMNWLLELAKHSIESEGDKEKMLEALKRIKKMGTFGTDILTKEPARHHSASIAAAVLDEVGHV